MPGVMLGLTELLFFRWMPAYGRRIKQHLRTLQGRDPGAFRIPLVPAHKRANASHIRIECLEAEIARREVILFVIKGIIGNVHLAVDPAQAAVRVNHDCGVVIYAWRALLE